MASFFEPPPPPPERPPQPPRRPWAGARDAVIGKTVALNLVIGRSEKGRALDSRADDLPRRVRV